MNVFNRLLEQPWVYKTWQAPFAAEKFQPVQKQLAGTQIRRVLDVGCGPGTNAAYFDKTEYVGIDINERYLELARARSTGRFICADLATADLSYLGHFDTVLVNSFLHHLPDADVHRLLGRLVQLLDARGHVHVLELVLPDRWSVAKLMARLDRGRYARSVEHWNTLLSEHFRPEMVEPYQLGRGLWSMVYFQCARK